MTEPGTPSPFRVLLIEDDEAMGISINTVRKHVRSVYEELHVHTRAEAVSKALRAGLLDPK